MKKIEADCKFVILLLEYFEFPIFIASMHYVLPNCVMKCRRKNDFVSCAVSLWLQGNVTFATSEDEISIKTKDSLKRVSKLLGVEEKELHKALTERVIAARGEVMQKAHTLSEAEYGRDALAKVCWHQVCSWTSVFKGR